MRVALDCHLHRPKPRARLHSIYPVLVLFNSHWVAFASVQSRPRWLRYLIRWIRFTQRDRRRMREMMNYGSPSSDQQSQCTSSVSSCNHAEGTALLKKIQSPNGWREMSFLTLNSNTEREISLCVRERESGGGGGEKESADRICIMNRVCVRSMINNYSHRYDNDFRAAAHCTYGAHIDVNKRFFCMRVDKLAVNTALNA